MTQPCRSYEPPHIWYQKWGVRPSIPGVRGEHARRQERARALHAEAGVDPRNSGNAPKMKVADCRSIASGESMRVPRLVVEVSVDRQRCARRESLETALDDVIAAFNCACRLAVSMHNLFKY